METILEDSISCVEQGIRLLKRLSPEVYIYKSADTLDSTVGGHFRHNIDHYESYLSGIERAAVDYDHRERDPIIETDPLCALRHLHLLVDRLRALEGTDLDHPLKVKMDCGSECADPWSNSSGRRELQFLLSHTVHHYALIAIICRLLGVEPEEDFGVAPSTLRYRTRASTTPACAH